MKSVRLSAIEVQTSPSARHLARLATTHCRIARAPYAGMGGRPAKPAPLHPVSDNATMVVQMPASRPSDWWARSPGTQAVTRPPDGDADGVGGPTHYPTR